MADEKVTNSEILRLRRRMEAREFALAAFYPQTHSGSLLEDQPSCASVAWHESAERRSWRRDPMPRRRVYSRLQ
jgi:hypothetical protein